MEKTSVKEEPVADSSDGDQDQQQEERPRFKRLTREEQQEKDDRTIFIGNVPLAKANKKDLMKLFSDCGRIESLRFRSIVPSKLTISKKLAAIKKEVHERIKSVNAYIVFQTKEAAQAAKSKNALEIDGHSLRVDSAGAPGYNDKKTIFVGNLPFDVQEDELRKVFRESGQVDAVRIVRDSRTGVGKGFAFVVFRRSDDTMLALEKHNEQLFRGREMRVKPLASRKGKNMRQVKKGLDKKGQDKRKATGNIGSGRQLPNKKKKVAVAEAAVAADDEGNGKRSKKRKVVGPAVVPAVESGVAAEPKPKKKKRKNKEEVAKNESAAAVTSSFSGEVSEKVDKKHLRAQQHKKKLVRQRQAQKSKRIVSELLSK